MGPEYAAELYELDITRDEIEDVNEGYYEPEPFNDVKPVLTDLEAAGDDCYVISNADPEMLEAMVETLEVEDLLSDVISAEEIKRFEPHAKLYRRAAERADSPSNGWPA